MADWAEQRAALLLIGPAKAGPVRQIGDSPCGTFWTDFLTNTIAAELRAERALAAEAVRERLENVLKRYRYAAEYHAAESWDGCPEATDILRWAREKDADSVVSPADAAVIALDYYNDRQPIAAALEADHDHTRKEGE